MFPVLPSLPSVLLCLLSPLRNGLIQSGRVPVLSVRIRPSESFVGELRFRQATGTFVTEAGSEVLLELVDMKRMHGDLPGASESFEDARRLRRDAWRAEKGSASSYNRDVRKRPARYQDSRTESRAVPCPCCNKRSNECVADFSDVEPFFQKS